MNIKTPRYQDRFEDRVYRLHAEICSSLANPKRLKIINVLREAELSVPDLLALLKVPKANLSQHMAVLKQKGIVMSRRKGSKLYYRLARPKILKAFDLMRELLLEVLEDQHELVRRYAKTSTRSSRGNPSNVS